MENTPNKTPTPSQTPQVPPEEEKKEKKNTFLVVIIIILLVLILLLGAFFMYKEGYFDTFLGKQNKVQEDETEDEQSTENTNQETYFEGESIKALQPNGWILKEYYNGEGTTSLPSDNTYEGLTGIEILNGEKQIFTIRAVSGIGFVGCPMYSKFTDFNPAHLQEQENIADEVGDSIEIKDYTTTEYEQFEWFGATFRRIGLNYYEDTVPNNNYFEPACEQGIREFEKISFTDSTGYTGHSYFFSASTNTTEEELLTVDTILESMTVK